MIGDGRCRSCGAAIAWAKTEKGRAMPLDPTPVANGNIEVRDGVAVYVTPDQAVERMVSHFATCPNARQHRKRGN